MKSLALNAVMLNEQSGGLGTYIRELLSGIYKETFPFGMDVLVDRNFPSDRFISLNINSSRSLDRLVKEWFLWPGLIKKYGWDLVHSPMSYFAPSIDIPVLLTIHDLRCFQEPSAYTWLRRSFLQKMILRSAHKAQKIITISDYSKQDIKQILNIPENKVKVIYNGVNREKFQQVYSNEEWIQIKRRYALPSFYLLAVGHLEPRKNYPRLLQAFSILKQKYAVTASLVIVGRENWQFSPIYETVKKLQLHHNVHFTQFVHENDLAAIYQNAKLFISASLFEGFGMPPLEAMAARVPVAVSKATCHPEIVGQAGVYFNPHDPEEMARVIAELLQNEQLQAQLIKRGEKNIERFSWSTCREETYSLYREILS